MLYIDDYGEDDNDRGKKKEIKTANVKINIIIRCQRV